MDVIASTRLVIRPIAGAYAGFKHSQRRNHPGAVGGILGQRATATGLDTHVNRLTRRRPTPRCGESEQEMGCCLSVRGYAAGSTEASIDPRLQRDTYHPTWTGIQFCGTGSGLSRNVGFAARQRKQAADFSEYIIRSNRHTGRVSVSERKHRLHNPRDEAYAICINHLLGFRKGLGIPIRRKLLVFTAMDIDRNERRQEKPCFADLLARRLLYPGRMDLV